MAPSVMSALQEQGVQMLGVDKELVIGNGSLVIINLGKNQ